MNRDDLLLVAGNVLSVSTEVSPSWRSDAVNTLLFSALHASSMRDKFVDTERWGAEFAKAMGKAKWNRSGYRSVVVEPDKEEMITVRERINKTISDLWGAGPVLQWELIQERIEQSPAPLEVWALLGGSVVSVAGTELEKTAGTSTLVLQINLLGEEGVIHSLFIHFSTAEQVDADFFNQAFLGGELLGALTVEVTQYTLDKKGYERSQIRELILSKLAGAADTMVVELCPNQLTDDDSQARID